ncbi:MAG: hypothetical protein HY363_02205 [Candidatus Aenigmarchaeota archaeon]|nr:hypothetical protein [Candidatus Aenigmarchaeota archaeon]
MGEKIPVEHVYEHQSDKVALADFTARVNRAFERFIEREELDCSDDVKELLAMQSIQGQAQTGMGVFDGRIGIGQFSDNRTLTYPNCTIDSVIRALNFNVAKIQKKRQKIIDDIEHWIDKVFEEAKQAYSLPAEQPKDICVKLVNDYSEPLTGMNLFSRIEPKNSLNVCRGVYLSSCMDNYEWRKKVGEKYGIELGGGECYATNMTTLLNLGLSLKHLSSQPHDENQREILETNGVIIIGDKVESSENIVMAYVRHAIGLGICDDSAMIMAALMHKIPDGFDKDRAQGVLLCDAVDTWDKCTPLIWKGGQDELLGAHVKKKFKELENYVEEKYASANKQMPAEVKNAVSLNISDEEVVNFIYAAHTDVENPHAQPDSSQRYFMKIVNAGKKMPVAEAHLQFIERFDHGYGTPTERRIERDFKAGFHRVPAKRFYNTLTKRFYALRKDGIINVA